ncbi:MAG: FHA domain-containing protein [Coriobacteriales bacterium]|nr:FHA domain-containing protein [Coriobacteriales bacterium]
MPECRCGENVPAGVRSCPACGADVSGATEQFEAITPEATEAAQLAAELAEGPALYVRKGPESGGTFYLDRDELTIGRDPESDIFLNDVTVSRDHAVIERSGSEVTVRDVGSLNGTYLNGQCADRAVLHDGDVLQIGTFQMVFIAGQGRS